MDTTTASGGIGSSIGEAYYLKNAKAVVIEMTAYVAEDVTYCHTATI